MKSSALKSSKKATAMRVVASDCDLRALIAQHLGVAVERVTDDVHLSDLGADWLDRLELMIVIESQLVGVDGTDADVEQIDLVGDFLRYIDSLGKDESATQSASCCSSNSQAGRPPGSV
jgi:acyl carrier protein